MSRATDRRTLEALLRTHETRAAALRVALELLAHADHDEPHTNGHRVQHRDLSSRELQILRGIAGGWSVSQIGRRLRLSVKTISTYRMRLLKKMQMRTTAQLMRYGIQHGLDQ